MYTVVGQWSKVSRGMKQEKKVDSSPALILWELYGWTGRYSQTSCRLLEHALSTHCIGSSLVCPGERVMFVCTYSECDWTVRNNCWNFQFGHWDQDLILCKGVDMRVLCIIWLPLALQCMLVRLLHIRESYTLRGCTFSIHFHCFIEWRLCSESRYLI